MEHIENRTFDEIAIGDTATLERTLTEQDIKLFAVMSGDINPAHVDPEYAMSSRFREVIGHGMWSGALRVGGADHARFGVWLAERCA